MVHLDVELAVGRGDDAHVDAPRACLADPPHLARLEDAEQLRLHVERHFANLVEKDRAARGGFECAHRFAVRAGKGTTRVTEQRALDERWRDGPAVDDDERLVRAGTALHDLRRHEVLARAALALDEDGGIARRDALDESEELQHRGRAPLHGAEGHRMRQPRGAAGVERAKTHRRLAELEATLGQRERRVPHPHAVDARAVQRLAVDDVPHAALLLETAVEARNVRVGDRDLVGVVGTHAHHVAVECQGARRGPAGLALDGGRQARSDCGLFVGREIAP